MPHAVHGSRVFVPHLQANLADGVDETRLYNASGGVLSIFREKAGHEIHGAGRLSNLCQKKHVRSEPQKVKLFEFQGTSYRRAMLTILALKAIKLLECGCMGFLVSNIDSSKELKIDSR